MWQADNPSRVPQAVARERIRFALGMIPDRFIGLVLE
jgi:hypothetical protein